MLELWYEQEPIAEIAETLERTEFAILCQLPWKAKVKLTEILSKIENNSLSEKVITLYLADYPELVDMEIDQKRISKAQKIREDQRKKRNKRISNLLREVEIRHLTIEKSGLEELVVKVFNTLDKKTLSMLEIKERLVWIHGLALLFPITEYDVLFSVYPQDGSRKKPYQKVSEELEMPKHQVALNCRNAINRLVMMLSVLGSNRKSFTPWINMNKYTYANMTLNNPKLVFPEVTLNYENIPDTLSLVDDFELTNPDIKTLHKANIFCMGNLLEFEYEDLRFDLKLDAGVARKIFSIKESYLKGQSYA